MLVTLVLLLASGPAFATEKPHVHGFALVNLALESPQKGEVDFDIPGDSVFGFEHVAKSDAERATVEKQLKLLRDGAPGIILFPPELKCTVMEQRAEIEKKKHGPTETIEGNSPNPALLRKDELASKHEDVSGGYTFSCEKPVGGANVTLGIFKILPRLKKVSFQALGNSKQVKRDVTSATDSVALAID